MNFAQYLYQFQDTANQLDKKILKQKGLEVAVGITLESVYLKLYKKSWANPSQDPLTSTSRIFFSIWVNEVTLAEEKLFYNIHALKLRQLHGYKIESRKFADTFRALFKTLEDQWPNVSTQFGPLTLIEGWLPLDIPSLPHQLTRLADIFLTLEPLIDITLSRFQR
ncbi:MAG: hypothetical protein WBB93_04125 [Saprospiraceae bacterium]